MGSGGDVLCCVCDEDGGGWGGGLRRKVEENPKAGQIFAVYILNLARVRNNDRFIHSSSHVHYSLTKIFDTRVD